MPLFWSIICWFWFLKSTQLFIFHHGQQLFSSLLSIVSTKKTSTVVHLLSLVQVSLQMSIREDILHHLYEGISTVILLLLFLPTFLQSKFLQPSLLVSLRSEIIQSSLPVTGGSVLNSVLGTEFSTGTNRAGPSFKKVKIDISYYKNEVRTITISQTSCQPCRESA